RDDLFEALSAIKDDQELGAVIFSGAGDRAFCAGADLTEFGTAPSRVIARQVRWERDVWGLFLSIETPLIAAMHGFVIGSGVEIGLCCDMRIASQDAQFSLPEVALGMIPAAGGTQTVPRLIRRSAALRMMLAGDRLNAEEALRIGLVNRIVPQSVLMNTAKQKAAKFLSMDPLALKYAKRAVNQGLDMRLEDGLDLERRLAALLMMKRKN
ncbi:MAG: enoyl-CoA hydratase/isomerase family protein, partial [Chloroflexota bacterium]